MVYVYYIVHFYNILLVILLLFSILPSSLSTLLRSIFEHHTANRGMAVRVRGKSRLPWLLLLVAVTAVLPSNADYSDNDIRSIVKNAVKDNPLFTNFPRPPDHHTGLQFAFLILISQQDYANVNTNIQLYPPPTQEDIYNHYPVQPGPRVRVNYMVARPDTPNEALQRRRQREHDERKLLVNSGQLLQKFESQFGRPAMALLYTWATPCPRCTNALLAAKRLLDWKYPRARIPISVVYSTDPVWRNSEMTAKENRLNRQRLQNAGFTVINMNIRRYGGQGGRTGGGGQFLSLPILYVILISTLVEELGVRQVGGVCYATGFHKGLLPTLVEDQTSCQL